MIRCNNVDRIQNDLLELHERLSVSPILGKQFVYKKVQLRTYHTRAKVRKVTMGNAPPKSPLQCVPLRMGAFQEISWGAMVLSLLSIFGVAECLPSTLLFSQKTRVFSLW